MCASRMQLHHPLAAVRSSLRRNTPAVTPNRLLQTTTIRRAAGGQDKNPGNAVPDDLDESFKGRTGGGEALDSSSPNAPPKPKISNLSVPGADPEKDLTKEQKGEVDQHNREFANKHDHGKDAPDDKVDKKYWTGETGGKP